MALDRERMAGFLSALAQAFQPRAHDLPSPPETDGDLKELGDRFLALTGGNRAITISRTEGEGTGSVLVEAPGVVEIREPLLARFLERNDLASLTLGGGMGREEIFSLVGIMGGPSFGDSGRTETREGFVPALREGSRGLASCLFTREIISTRRTIPWRVVLALSRLRGDLSHLPPDTARRARLAVLHEVQAPLRDGPLAASFLVNIDLASTPELAEEELENEVIASLEEPVFLGMVPPLADLAKGLPEGLSGERFDRILGKLAFRLNQAQGSQARSLLVHLFDAGLLAMENLPPAVQERVVAIRLAESFLERKDDHLAALEAAADPETYALRARPSAQMVPCLVEKGRYAEAADLAAMIFRHSAEGSGRSRAAEEAVGVMVERGALEEAKKAFLAANKEERTLVARFLSVFGGGAAGYLASSIRETDDPWKKKQAADLLMESGGEAQASLVDLAEDASLPRETAAIVLRVLGGVRDPDLAHLASRTVLSRVADPAPEVRRAALRSLCLLAPRGNFPTFRKALDDPDPGVRREAVRGLGLSGEGKAVPLLLRMAERAEGAQGEEDRDSASSAVDALGHAFEANPGRRDEISDFLLDLADRSWPAGRVARLVRGRTSPPLLLLALSYALARVGGARSAAFLTRLSRHPDPALAEKAAAFLQRMG